MRVAIVPPAPTPYREPLFGELANRHDMTVVYQSAREPGWDVPEEWFPAEHPYPARHLRSWQRRRLGRTPIVWPRGLERALGQLAPDCVISWEYGPASLRALRWCRRHKRGFVIFTECTPHIDRLLAAARHATGSERSACPTAESTSASSRPISPRSAKSLGAEKTAAR